MLWLPTVVCPLCISRISGVQQTKLALGNQQHSQLGTSLRAEQQPQEQFDLVCQA